MKNYWRCHCGDGGFDQNSVVAPRLRCDGGINESPDCDTTDVFGEHLTASFTIYHAAIYM